MGAWAYVSPRLRVSTGNAMIVRYIGRPERASPAEGYEAAHKAEQQRIVAEALTIAQDAPAADRERNAALRHVDEARFPRRRRPLLRIHLLDVVHEIQPERAPRAEPTAEQREEERRNMSWMNYGFDKVRFVSPVKVDSRIRASSVSRLTRFVVSAKS